MASRNASSIVDSLSLATIDEVMPFAERHRLRKVPRRNAITATTNELVRSANKKPDQRGNTLITLQQLVRDHEMYPSKESPLNRASKLFCEGPLLAAVQNAGLFHDCKEFVDMPMRMDPEIIMREFTSWKALNKIRNEDDFKTLPPKTKENFRKFIDAHFLPAGSDLEPVELPDYYPEPDLLHKIKDTKLRNWALGLNRIWNTLGRRVTHGVFVHPQRHSLLPCRRILVVPGGRFREIYYWDTYWIVEGLLAVGMKKTAKGVVSNLIDLVEKFGFIANGSRCYYFDRSQPPMLAEMVRIVFEATNDLDFLKRAVVQLDREYKFWMEPKNGKLVKVRNQKGTFTLNRYYSTSTTPRPESYREDIHTASFAASDQQSEKFRDIRTGAESGWDFTSRWFADTMTMETIDATHVIPVDLNCMLYKMEMDLSDFHGILKKKLKSWYYKKQAAKRAKAIEKILWMNNMSQWRDVRINDAGLVVSVSKIVSVSNWFPLWSKCHLEMKTIDITAVCKSLLSSGLLAPGGISTTMSKTGQQWDYPNAWAPLQWLIIEGLRNTNDLGKRLAFAIAQTWVGAGYEAYDIEDATLGLSQKINLGDTMYEKYDSTIYGSTGGGGEYIPQTGFGWTNGVILSLLKMYGDRLTSSTLWSRVHRSAEVY
jgi:alpha,alpha-trehalase